MSSGDRTVEGSVAFGERAVGPDLTEALGEQAVAVAVARVLAVLAAGDQHDGRPYGGRVALRERLLEGVVFVAMRLVRPVLGMSRGMNLKRSEVAALAGEAPKNMSRTTEPLWQLSDSTRMRTPGLNLDQSA